MTLKDQMQADLDDVFFNVEEFGENIIYKPKDGSFQSSIIMVPTEDDPVLSDAQVLGDSLVVRIQTSDIASPEVGDEIVWNDESWYVTDKRAGGVQILEWELEITRSELRIL